MCYRPSDRVDLGGEEGRKGVTKEEDESRSDGSI